MNSESLIDQLNRPLEKIHGMVVDVSPSFPAASEIVRRFRESDSSERERIASLLNPSGCGVIVSYAREVADIALKENEPDRVREGLAAVALEAGRVDCRDSLLALYQLYLSGQKMGLDVAMLFQGGYSLVTKFSWPGFSVEYRDFVFSKPDERFGQESAWDESLAAELKKRRSIISRVKRALGWDG